MADVKTESKGEAKKEPGSASAEPKKSSSVTKAAPPAKPQPEPELDAGPPMLMRILMGFSGLSLVFGFAPSWVRLPGPENEDGTPGAMQWVSGWSLGIEHGDIAGTPAPVLFAVPILGMLLAAAAFMGFRWAAHVAIGVSTALLLYGLWVMILLFVENTGTGLWVTVGGTFVTLVFGIVTLIWTRERAARASSSSYSKSKASEPEPAHPAKSKA